MIETRVAGPPARAIAAMAAILAACALSSLGGCTVTSGSREPASTKVRDVLDSGHGRFDLTRPPSRDEAGMPAGRSNVSYQRDDHRPFQVQVALPGGKELNVQARLLAFDSMAGPDPSTAAPSTLDIHTYPADPQAARDRLLADAQQFGLDAGLVHKWYQETRSDLPNQAPATAESPWLHATVGYLRLDVQARYSPPVNGSDPGQTLVHYLLTWPPGATAATS